MAKSRKQRTRTQQSETKNNTLNDTHNLEKKASQQWPHKQKRTKEQ